MTAVMDKKISRIAVVGSGLAGQVIAYLLQSDPQERYEVEMFESGEILSLAAVSVRASEMLPSVDVPMRTFTSGYYRNLMAMYDYFGIKYHEETLRFVFARRSRDTEAGAESRPYFIQASDAQGLFAEKPSSMSWIAYYLELGYMALCVCWLTFTFWVIADPDDDESFEAYLKRWRAPRRFTNEYLVPLLSSIATCSHEEMLQFPASDIVRYRREVKSQRQYLVTGGVKNVQDRLTSGLTIHTQARVSSVESGRDGVVIGVETLGDEGEKVNLLREFDQVILAVSPDIAGRIFLPGKAKLSQIPVRQVDTMVQRSDAKQGGDIDDIFLDTSFSDRGWTEATHIHHSGLAITSCVREDNVKSSCLARHQFTRTLRTAVSRRIVQDIFTPVEGRLERDRADRGWSNGDEHVWMVGAWCWDGMILLEGAVVSAMRVAGALGVNVPWEKASDGQMRTDRPGS